MAGNPEIFLLRHGQTEWNAAGRVQGHHDSPLTERGVTQANAVGRLLARSIGTVDAFYASPLGRVRQTTLIIRSCRDYPEPLWDDRLREVSLGCWDGLSQIDIHAGWPGMLDGASAFDWYFRAPDGESYEAALARANEWLDGLKGVVVAVSHGLIGRIIRGAYLGLAKDEAFSLPVPHDVIWRLADGEVEAIP